MHGKILIKDESSENHPILKKKKFVDVIDDYGYADDFYGDPGAFIHYTRRGYGEALPRSFNDFKKHYASFATLSRINKRSSHFYTNKKAFRKKTDTSVHVLSLTSTRDVVECTQFVAENCQCSDIFHHDSEAGHCGCLLKNKHCKLRLRQIEGGQNSTVNIYKYDSAHDEDDDGMTIAGICVGLGMCMLFFSAYFSLYFCYDRKEGSDDSLQQIMLQSGDETYDTAVIRDEIHNEQPTPTSPQSPHSAMSFE